MSKIDNAQRSRWAWRGLPATGAPMEWDSGPWRWKGTGDLEPLEPDTAYGDEFLMPGRTRFRFTGEPPAPTIEFEIRVRDKWPELVSFTVTASVSSGIRTADLRNVHVDALIELVAELASIRVEQVGESVWEQQNPEGRAARAIRSSRQRGRPRLSEDDIRRAADIYRDHLPGGRPLEAVRTAFSSGDGTISERTAARYIERARTLGFLPPTTKGKPSA